MGMEDKGYIVGSEDDDYQPCGEKQSSPIVLEEASAPSSSSSENR
jgi:hypothetical protein